MSKVLLIILLFLSTSAYAQQYPLALKEWTGTIADLNAVYMTCGQRWFDAESSDKYNQKHHSDVSIGKFYRVYFLVYEIYYSLLIEEMEYSGVEGSKIKSVNTYFITGFEIGTKALKYNRLTDLHFVNWDSWNTFIVKESDTKLKIRIKPQGKFSVEKLE